MISVAQHGLKAVRSVGLHSFWLLWLHLLFVSSFVVRAESISFPTEILPILTRSGCNAGACHGAATGQGGFKLSLLGYDPDEDYLRITRELGGRRISLPHPSSSLILRKNSGELDHEGGRRLGTKSPARARLMEWINAGAPYGPADLRVSSIRVSPAEIFAPSTNKPTQLKVVARLSDGRSVDVTHLALFTSNDEGIATVDRDGRVTVIGRGVTSIMIRHGGQVGVARILSPLGNHVPDFSKSDRSGWIDDLILKELRRLRIPASPTATDAAFLRRVHLDLIGRLPTESESRAFLASPSTRSTREQLVARLLERPEFTDLWTHHFAEVLLVGGKRSAPGPTQTYHQWLRHQIESKAPFDRLARSLLTASGNIQSNGPASFFALASDPRDLAEHVGRIFLGTRIGCARCHAHPSDRWTQEDYHRFAAFFARVSREGDVVQVAARGEVEHPKSGKPLVPAPLGAMDRPDRPAGAAVADPDRRIAVAEWITSGTNTLFTRTVVNRVWRLLMGRGLVEPVDDLRSTNPATHPALLQKLADEFAANGFDQRWLIRTIAGSMAYQRSSIPLDANRLDDRFYSHARLRDLPAAVFLDLVSLVTEVPQNFEGADPGTLAVQLAGPMVGSFELDVLGRCARDASCDTVSRNGGGMAMALHLINGTTINQRLSSSPFVHQLESLATDETRIEKMYLRLFCRFPRPEEVHAWLDHFSKSALKTHAIQDALWTLLNSREFCYNH